MLHWRMQDIDKLRSERNVVASAMKGKLDLAFREELIEQVEGAGGRVRGKASSAVREVATGGTANS
jgi:hypothetical protein